MKTKRKKKTIKEKDKINAKIKIIMFAALTFFACIILRILYLNIFMANYYNIHKRAKEQFCHVLRKEGLI